MSVDGSVVKLRQKTATIGDSNNDSDDNKSMRRISYLRATQGTNDSAFHMMVNDDSPVAAVTFPQTEGDEVETPDNDAETAINVQKM